MLLGLAIAILTSLVAGAALWPPSARVESHPRPAVDYQDALARVEAMRAAEGDEVSPVCRTLLLTHGHRTARVVLFFHGLTNCPDQFRALAERLFARGDNVYVPRIPHHGLANRMTTDLKRTRAEELAEFADRQVDIARGLGERVIVSGLSLGATQAAWVAQERSDVDLAAPIAPMLGVAMAPGVASTALANLWVRIPNQFMWWDPKKREALAGPNQVYPRFSTRAVAEVIRLGWAVRHRAREKPPAARRILAISVGGDIAVDNRATVDLVREWRRRGGERVSTYQFADSLRLGHDLIDPRQPYQRIDVVYPILEQLLGT